jgi:hypothetical protein
VLPDSFSYSAGNGRGGGSLIELNGRTLSVSRRRVPTRQPYQEVSLTPSKSKWAALRKAFDEVDAWSWEPEYIQSGLRDGSSRSLAVTYPDGRRLEVRVYAYGAAQPPGWAKIEKLLDALEQPWWHKFSR